MYNPFVLFGCNECNKSYPRHARARLPRGGSHFIYLHPYNNLLKLI